MKKIIYLIAILSTFTSFAQQGSKVSAPADTVVDSIATLDATGTRLRHIPYSSFEAKLKSYFDTLYTVGGGGVTNPMTANLNLGGFNIIGTGSLNIDGSISNTSGDYTYLLEDGFTVTDDVTLDSWGVGPLAMTFYDFSQNFSTRFYPPTTPIGNTNYYLPTKSAGTYTLATLEDLVADNLGNHTATTNLIMGTYQIQWNSNTSRIRENTGALELESDAGNFITRGGVNNISSAKYDYLIGIDSDNNVSNDHFNVYFGLNTVSNRLLYIVQDGQATLPNTTTSDIDTAGAKAIITKEYADANYSGGGSGDDVSTFAEKPGALVGTDRLVGLSGATDFNETISGIPLSIFNDDLTHTVDTDDQTAIEVPITDTGGIITATNVEDALQENRTAIDLNTAKVSEDKFSVIQIACSDLTTNLTTGTTKAYFRMPYAATLTGVRASVLTAPTGSTISIGINESASTILSTDLTIDATEKTSTTATTAAVISDSSLADDAEITIDIDQIGSTVAGAGLIVELILTRL